jgi:hypothetical protein
VAREKRGAAVIGQTGIEVEGFLAKRTWRKQEAKRSPAFQKAKSKRPATPEGSKVKTVSVC